MNYEAPRPEEYSRVSDPEKFRPIEVHVRRKLEGIRWEFDVEVEKAETPVHGVDPKHVVASYLIIPNSINSAPVHISITAFPGVRVKFGVGTSASFPRCGCDACRETAAGEIERFEFLLNNVISGRFEERVFGLLRKKFETHFWSESGFQTGGEILGKTDPRRKLRRQTFRWKPWPKRRLASQGD